MKVDIEPIQTIECLFFIACKVKFVIILEYSSIVRKICLFNKVGTLSNHSWVSQISNSTSNENERKTTFIIIFMHYQIYHDENMDMLFLPEPFFDVSRRSDQSLLLFSSSLWRVTFWQLLYFMSDVKYFYSHYLTTQYWNILRSSFIYSCPTFLFVCACK